MTMPDKPKSSKQRFVKEWLSAFNFPAFQDDSIFTTIPVLYADGFMDPNVHPVAADPTMQGVISIIALAANVIVLAVIIKRSKELKRNPYKEEIFVGTRDYELAMARADK